MTTMTEGIQETPEEMFPVSTSLGAMINESLAMPREMLPPGSSDGTDKEDEPGKEPQAATQGPETRKLWIRDFVQTHPYAVAASVAGAGFTIGLVIAAKRRRQPLSI